MEIEDIERNLETQAEAGSSSRKVKLKAEQTEAVAEVSRHKAKMDDDNHAIGCFLFQCLTYFLM